MHSLLPSDEKAHQVASYATGVRLTEKWGDLNAQFVKMNVALEKVNTQLGTFELKTDAAGAFLAKEDTAVNALKVGGVGLDGLVQGHGQVVTGELAAGVDPAIIVVVPGLLTVNGDVPVGKPPEATLHNTSDGTLLVNVAGAPGGTQQLGVGASLSLDMSDGGVLTVQVIGQGGGSPTTLTLSSFGDGSVHRLVGQALVGSP
jgi:hypothetical protein